MPRITKQRNSKRFEKSVKAIVHKELTQELEEKHAITEYSNVPILPSIPTGVVLNGQGNFFKLMPEIFQSSTGAAGSAYNERVGNEINLKEVDINGFLNFGPASIAGVDYKNAKLAVRVMILRAKEVNDQELLFDNMPTDGLIRFGEQATGAGGPVQYVGLPLDSFREINRDTFSVRYDKVHYLNAPATIVGTTSVTTSNVPSGLKMIKHKLTFGKGLKLKYSASTDTQANNFPYFMVIGYSSMSQNAVPDNNLIQATFQMRSRYTDA
ncbi:MAG: capsid protein [Cressdnaviricota sp.]|nr:MAG: capsid protein [Cressdnaviricota sp.]